LEQVPFKAVPAAAVVARLNAEDASLQANARWVLQRHPEWGDAGAAFLGQLLEKPNPTEADLQALAKFLPIFASNSTVTRALAESLTSTNAAVNEAQRAQLLDGIAALSLREPPVSLASAVVQCIRAPSSTVALAAIRAAAALRLSTAQEPLASIAFDSGQDVRVRLEAMRELVRRQPTVGPAQMDFLLGELCDTNVPAARLAAAEIVVSGKLSPKQINALLRAVQKEPAVSPALILGLVERNGLAPEIAVPFLDYLAGSMDAGWTISAEQLIKVQAAVPQGQRAAANALVARLSESISRQRQQLMDFVPLLTGGDYVRGEKVFYEKGQCTTCHRIWENGGRVGPDLSKVGTIRSGRDILESLLIPSSTIAQGYETLNVTTEDGETYTGIRVGSSDNPLRLRLASGSEVVLHQNQIKGIERSKVSLMPEGLLNNLKREEMRDLLAFLQHLKDRKSVV